ncbi:MAG: hypothetical protein QM758_03860 [Armatimonas sp.]
MTFAWRSACKAALLSDEEAVPYLRNQLDTLPGKTPWNYEALLTALAWFEPEEALEYYDTVAEKTATGARRAVLEAYVEARELRDYTEEQKAVYATITALLPPDAPETVKRHIALGIACAQRSLQNLVAVPGQGKCIDFFLFSRLWLAFPEALQERLRGEDRSFLFWRLNANAVGQYLLGTRLEEGDIPRLITLAQERCQENRSVISSLEGMCLHQTLQILEAHAPEELCRLVPEVLAISCIGKFQGNTRLIAQLLTKIVDLHLDTTRALLPLEQKIHHHGVSARHWLRKVRRNLPLETSTPEAALRLIRPFRLFVTLRRIEELLCKEECAPSSTQVWRAQRWLRRTQRFIDSIEFSFWRERLQERLDSLRVEVA